MNRLDIKVKNLFVSKNGEIFFSQMASSGLRKNLNFYLILAKLSCNFVYFQLKVKNLRICDLQIVLGSQNQNRNGRKDELIKRIFDLYKKSSDRTKEKLSASVQDIVIKHKA